MASCVSKVCLRGHWDVQGDVIEQGSLLNHRYPHRTLASVDKSVTEPLVSFCTLAISC